MTGIFTHLAESEILEIRAAAIEAAKAGKVTTSFSSPGLSGSSQMTMPPQEILLECKYALQKLDPDTYGRDFLVTRTKPVFI